MKPVDTILATALFSTWICAAAYCFGAVDQPPNASPGAPAAAPAEDTGKLQESCEKSREFKPISQLTASITPSPGDLPQDCPLGNATYRGRSFAPITYMWTASGLCHRPLYFEEEHLERYGHTFCPLLQPFVSGAHFFLTFPILPYEMGLEPPNECIYTLGQYQPGDCVPYSLDPIPLSVRASLFEAGAWVGGVFAFP